MVHGSDNSFYLTHGADKQPYSSGAIFIDANAQKDFKDENTIIYGHNMWHDTMFTHIEKFKDKEFLIHIHIYISIRLIKYTNVIFSVFIQQQVLLLPMIPNMPVKKSMQNIWI